MLRKLSVGIAGLLLLVGSGEALGQAALPSVVQLPSFSTFQYSGTVVVPDSGGAYLGGVNRYATGMNRRGRGLGHGLGAGLGRSGASVHATIIDLDEMDRHILGGTPSEFIKRERALEAQARSGKKAEPGDPDAEGKALVRFARKMYKEGNHSKSFDGYLLAIDVLSPKLSDLAAAEFHRVFGQSAVQATRMQKLRR